MLAQVERGAMPAVLVVPANAATPAADLAGAVAAATASGPVRYISKPSDPGYYLRWTPPALTTPTTLVLSASGGAQYLDNGKDYIVVMPPSKVTNQIKLVGGRNIVSLGGYATLGGAQLTGVLAILDSETFSDFATTSGSATVTSASAGFTTTWTGRGVSGPGIPAGATLTFVNATTCTLSANATATASGVTVVVQGQGTTALTSGRVVHIEGWKIDASGGLSHDGIDLNCPNTIVQIQNCRVTGITGASTGVHADIIQNQGGCLGLRIDRFTGTTDYQGLFLPPSPGTGGNTGSLLGPVKLSNVNLSYWRVNPVNATTYLLWMSETSNQDFSQVDMRNVYLDASVRSQTVIGNSIWPTPTSPAGAAPVQNGSTITYPTVPSLTGTITEGTPGGGDYVPDANCGLGYVSPGYYPAKQAGTSALFVEEGTTNGVRNPSCETNTTDYGTTGSGVITLSQVTDGVFGTKCLSIAVDGTASSQGMNYGNSLIAALPGQTWTISAWLKLSSGAGNWIFEIVERSSGAFLASSPSSALAVSSTWTRFSFTYTLVNASTTFVTFRIRQTGTAAAGTVLVDGVQMEQKGHATTYCDGTQTGCSWSGTAHASASSRTATRVNYASASHIDPARGSVAAWVYLPTYAANGYIWSAGSYQTASQDFIGLQVNSAGTGLQAVCGTGTGAPSTVAASNQFSAGAWHFVVVSWKGTNVTVAVDQASLTSGTRPAVAGSINTAIEIGARTDGTLYADGYVGPLAVFRAPMTRRQASRLFARRAQFAVNMLPERLMPELVSA